jgi:hypothetical protein
MNKDYLPFKTQLDAESSLFEQNDEQKNLDEKKRQAKYQGLCPYGFNQGFYYHPQQDALFKGTF